MQLYNASIEVCQKIESAIQYPSGSNIEAARVAVYDFDNIMTPYIMMIDELPLTISALPAL